MSIKNSDIKAEINRAAILTPSEFRASPLRIMSSSILLNAARYTNEQGRLDDPDAAEKQSVTRYRQLFGSSAILPDAMNNAVEVRSIQWEDYYKQIYVEYLVKGNVVIAGQEETHVIVGRANIPPLLITSIMAEYDHSTFAEPYKVPADKVPTETHKQTVRQKAMRDMPPYFQIRNMIYAGPRGVGGGPSPFYDHFEGAEAPPNFEELIAHGKVKLVPAEDGKFTLEIEGLTEKYAERARLEAEAQAVIDEHRRLLRFQDWLVGESVALEKWLQEKSPPKVAEA